MKDPKLEFRSPNHDEGLWKHRFERLSMYLDDLSIEAKNAAFEVAGKRAWDAMPTICVSFSLDVIEDEEQAKSEWGEGNYDVYKLVRTGRDPYEVPT